MTERNSASSPANEAPPRRKRWRFPEYSPESFRGATSPILEGGRVVAWIDLGDPDCGVALRRVITRAIDDVGLEFEDSIPAEVNGTTPTESKKSTRASFESFLLHVAWMESNGGTTRFGTRDVGRRSLFGLTLERVTSTFKAADPWQQELLIDSTNVSNSNGAAFDPASMFERLALPEYDLLAAQIAALRLYHAAKPSEWKKKLDVLTRSELYANESDIWWGAWRAPVAQTAPIVATVEDAERVEIESEKVTKTSDADAAATAAKVERVRDADKATFVYRARKLDESTQSQESTQQEKLNSLLEKLRDVVVEKPITFALTIPAIFSLSVPLLFKWYGGTQTEPGNLNSFVAALRMFAIAYIALPPLLVLAIVTETLSILFAALLVEAAVLLAYRTDDSAIGAAMVIALVAAAVLLPLIETHERKPHRRSIRSQLKRAVVLTSILAFVYALSGLAWPTAEKYQSTFGERTDVTIGASQLRNDVASLDSARGVALARARSYLAPLPAVSDATVLSLSRRAIDDRRLLEAVLTGPRQPDSNSTGRGWIAAGTRALTRLRASEASLVRGLVALEPRWDTLSKGRPVRIEEARVYDAVRVRSDSVRATVDRATALGDGVLLVEAQTAFEHTRKVTQQSWSGELRRIRVIGLASLIALLVGILLWIRLTVGDTRKRASVLAGGVAVMILPLLRPVNPDEIDPLHPFSTFMLPSSSLVGAVSNAIPLGHKPNDDVKQPDKPVGKAPTPAVISFATDSAMVELRRRFDTVDAATRALDGKTTTAHTKLDTVVERVRRTP
ncbi:MAG: hypothetical protein ABJE10_00545 [bacterium]